MDWRDEGILLTVRRHGETSAIIEVLTRRHGRHAGLVRGGAGKARAAMLQPGAQLALDWHGRLADHLGTYRVELIHPRAPAIMARREALAALNAVSALLVRLLPEREADPHLHDATLDLADALARHDSDWPSRYAFWEFILLRALGFGLDLDRCAATGVQADLVYVSPRSGRAVSRAAGAPYADRLLPLPRFLIGQGAATPADVCRALALTGWFLDNRARPAFGLAELPGARGRLLHLLERMAGEHGPQAGAGAAVAGPPAGPARSRDAVGDLKN